MNFRLRLYRFPLSVSIRYELGSSLCPMEFWGLLAEDVLVLQFEALAMVLCSCRKLLWSAAFYVIMYTFNNFRFE